VGLQVLDRAVGDEEVTNPNDLGDLNAVKRA